MRVLEHFEPDSLFYWLCWFILGRRIYESSTAAANPNPAATAIVKQVGSTRGGTSQAPPSPSETGGTTEKANVGADISSVHIWKVHAQCQNA